MSIDNWGETLVNKGRLLLGALCAAAVMGALPAAASAAPTVTTGQPTSINTTGAAVTVTINPNGVDTLYKVNYGRTGGALSSSTGYMDAGAGNQPVTKTVVLSSLTPSSSYTYQAEVFQNDTQADVTGNTVTFTTTANPSGPGKPIVPPQNPPGNGIFTGGCATDAACVSDSNGVRADQESLPGMSLPTNYSSLTPAEQMFVDTNIERVSRGLVPIPNLVNSYDQSVEQGMKTDSDPSLAGLPGPAESIWAGGNATVTGAMYGWLYDDGYQSGNLDCTTPTAAGCWGHRNAILDNPGGTIGNATEMDAAAGTDNNGTPSYAATFVNNPNPPSQGSVVFTWAQEQPFLSAPPRTGPRGHAPKLRQLVLSRSSFRALPGATGPSFILNPRRDSPFGTVVSYRDSQRGVSTFTVQRCVSSHRRVHGTRVCTRYRTMLSFTHDDAAGLNRLRFTGRLNGHPLKRGMYRFIIVPRNASGQVGAHLERAFKII